MVLDETKMKNAVSASFENLKKLEKDNSFHEAKKDSKNQPVTFLNMALIKMEKQIYRKILRKVKIFYKRNVRARILIK